jgi:NlpC/P60 family
MGARTRRRPGRHAAPRKPHGRRAAGIAAAAAAPVLAAALASSPAQAAALTPLQREQIAMNWAITQAGSPYTWGGNGPYWAGYDCSGLVVAAFHRIGVYLPRTTYEMLASPLLVRIPLASARRGDLLFYGAGHVELDTVWWHTSFGELNFGTRAGWHQWNSWWQPTEAFRLRLPLAGCSTSWAGTNSSANGGSARRCTRCGRPPSCRWDSSAGW